MNDLQTAANELLRDLNREVFNDQIDIEKLPQAVGLVEDFARAYSSSQFRLLASAMRKMLPSHLLQEVIDHCDPLQAMIKALQD